MPGQKEEPGRIHGGRVRLKAKALRQREEA